MPNTLGMFIFAFTRKLYAIENVGKSSYLDIPFVGQEMTRIIRIFNLFLTNKYLASCKFR